MFFSGPDQDDGKEGLSLLFWWFSLPLSKKARKIRVKGGSLHDGFGGFGGSGISVENALPSSCWSYKIQDKKKRPS